MNGVITSGCMFLADLIVSVCSLVILLDALLYNGAMYSDFEVNNAYLIGFCSAILFILSCFADDAVDAGLKPPQTAKTDKNGQLNQPNGFIPSDSKPVNVSPRVYSSFLSQITFFWFIEFFKILEKKKTLEHSDLWELDESLKMENVARRFDRGFAEEMQCIKLNQNSTKRRHFTVWNMIRLAWRFCGKEVLVNNLLLLVSKSLMFLRPIQMGFLIKFISDPDEKRWHGILLVGGFVGCSIFKNIFDSFYHELTNRINDNLEMGLKNLLYLKATSISNKARNKSTTGKIINLISSDAWHFSSLPDFLETLWSTPLHIGETLLMLFKFWFN